MPVFSAQFKSDGIYLFYIQQKIILNGTNMSPLVLSTRALKVVNQAIHLFNQHGFYLVGVDRIVKESEITKMTFYHYFQSKAWFIEICLLVQNNVFKTKSLQRWNMTKTQT